MGITFTEGTGGIRYAKVLVLGDSGVGKTHFGLTFPEPLAIDSENALAFFEDRFKFKSARTRSYDEINQLMDQAINGRISGKTLVVDSITGVYKALQEAHPDDAFMKITSKKFNKLIDKLYGKVPMHVVMTAWEKAEYAAKGTKIPGTNEIVGKDDRIVLGYKADVNQKAIYAFDFVFRLMFDTRTKRRYAIVIKSRSNKWQIGEEIENPSFADFESIINVNAKFTPSMLNEEAAEIDLAAEKREEAAMKVAAATVKDVTEAPASGSREHIRSLLGDYNLIATEKIKGIKATDWLRQQGFEFTDWLTVEDQPKAVALIEGMIAKEQERDTQASTPQDVQTQAA